MKQDDKKDWEKERLKFMADYSDENILMIENLPLRESHRLSTLRIDSFCFLMNLSKDAEVAINEKIFRVKRGESIVLVPNTKIRMQNCDETCCCLFLSLSIHFTKETFYNERDIMEQMMQIVWNPIQPENRDLYANIQTYHELLVRLTAPSNNNRFKKQSIHYLIKACIYEGLGYVLRECSQGYQPKGTSGERLFQKFVMLLSSMDYTERQVAFYANKLCITPKYLSTLCQQISGKSASKWINNFMIERIRRQLCYSEKSIKEIADDLDFPNVSFFGRYVKKHLGYSPISYRNMKP